MSDLKVRGLQVDDLLVLANMLLSISDDAKAEISGIIVSGVKQEMASDAEESVSKEKLTPEEQEINEQKKKSRQSEVGTKVMFIVLQSCLRHAQEEIKAWMASLIDATPEDFGKMPIDTPLDIISQLKSKEDLPNFFSKAFTLYSEMTESAKQYMKK